MPRKVPRLVPENISQLTTKSARIRALKKLGWETGDIARAIGVYYQFAYNVLKRPLKREIKRLRDEAKAKEQEQDQQKQEQETTNESKRSQEVRRLRSNPYLDGQRDSLFNYRRTRPTERDA